MKLSVLTILFIGLCAFKSVRTDKPSYAFDTSMEVKVDSYKKNGNLDHSQTVMLYTNTKNDGSYFGMEVDAEGASGFMVYDNSLQKMITLVDMGAMKTAMGIKIKPEKSKGEEEAPLKFEKTGQTKTVNGFSCDEYKATKDGETHYYYSTQETEKGLFKFFLNMYGQRNKQSYAQNMPEGTVLQIVNIDDKSRKTEMTVMGVKENIEKTVNLSDYKTMGIK